MSEPAVENREEPQTNGDTSRKHDIEGAESEAKRGKVEGASQESKAEAEPKKQPEKAASDSDSDSDDDTPMCQRMKPAVVPKKPVEAVPAAAAAAAAKAKSDSDSDDDVPLAALTKSTADDNKKPAVKEAKKTVVKEEKKPKKEAPAKRSKGKVLASSSDSSDEDEPPKKPASKVKVEKAAVSSRPGRQAAKKKPIIDNSDSDSDESDSEDDVPLKKVAAKPKKAAAAKKKPIESDSDSEDDVPLKKAAKPKVEKKTASKKRPAPMSDSDSDDDVPLGQMKKSTTAAKKKAPAKKAKKEGEATTKKEVKPKKEEPERFKWWLPENQVKHENGEKWLYLEHKGVLFPPAYEPHGVKMLYDGEAVDLEPEAEEAATFYAQKLETDYVKRTVFQKNFFKDWSKLLGKKHKIQQLDKCDFRPIYEYLQVEKEKKKEMTKEQKAALKETKEKVELHYGWCTIDKHKEKIGNFRVEIPGLFMGRGEHPKQGKIKRRTVPEDVTLNHSEDAPEIPVPENMAGHKWADTIHNNMVTWLAMYKDSICGETKYVFLNANSTFKGQSDMAKFEKARLLKKHIEKIRKDYTSEYTNEDALKMQRSTALYLIDKLALRVGGEKDTDEEADTVGCCSLRQEHVTFIEEEAPEGSDEKPKYIVHFKFLGKDSIEYNAKQALDKKPWKNLKRLAKEAAKRMEKDKNDQDLFPRISPSAMNSYLTSFMPGLTAKVFRTYNASITLDRLCTENELDEDMSVNNKMVLYNQWNRDVAVLCNHQKAKSKTFDASMDKVRDKLNEQKEKLAEATKAKKKAKSDKDDKAVTKFKKQMAQLTERIAAIEAQMQTKEDLATVSLGTSKINYLDPRITVAWCKREDVPLTKVFPKTLIAKFEWATDADEDFRF